MAGRELGRVGVVQIRHALVPVIAGDLAGVGARDERNRAPHLDLGGVVAEPRPLRHLGLVVHVRVAALLDRRSARDEKPGEIPVGRPLPAPQPLVGQRMTGPRADEVEPERADDRPRALRRIPRGESCHFHMTPNCRDDAVTDCHYRRSAP